MPITILRPGTTFTTFEFYNVFLKDVALFYKNGNNNISCIAIDKVGNIWYGLDKMTLKKYDGKTFTTFSQYDN